MMRRFLVVIALATAGFGQQTAPVSAQGVQCADFMNAYENLFSDGNKRVLAVRDAFQALPKNANQKTKDGLRKKFCSVSGEIVGMFKVVIAQTSSCATKGEALGDFPDVMKKQLAIAEGGVNDVCN